METLWERLKNGLFEGAVTVAERAEHLGYVGRIRLDIANDRRLLQASFADLGRRVYHILQENAEDVTKDGDVLDLVRRLREREEVLHEREAALASLMRAGDPASPASSQEK